MEPSSLPGSRAEIQVPDAIEDGSAIVNLASLSAMRMVRDHSTSAALDELLIRFAPLCQRVVDTFHSCMRHYDYEVAFCSLAFQHVLENGREEPCVPCASMSLIAGASEVAVVSRHRWAIIHETRDGEEPSLADILAKLEPCGLVIVEGYKRDSHDKIEVRNLALTHPELAGDDPTVVAIAANGQIAGAPVPVFDRDDVSALASFIENHTGIS